MTNDCQPRNTSTVPEYIVELRYINTAYCITATVTVHAKIQYNIQNVN